MPSIVIGGRTLDVRPLNLKTLRLVLPKLDVLRGGVAGDAQIDAVLDLAQPALARGNEGVTREWLEEELDITQLPELLRVVTEASGLGQAAPGEAPSP